MAMTKIQDLINPTVMADMISGKIGKKLVVTPFAKIDDTLVGVPGDTIKVPQYAYIGDAEDVAEGESAQTAKLGVSAVEVTVKKAMKAVELSDEAVISGYGNPVGETNNQLALAIASKIDDDSITALMGAQKICFLNSIISYHGIVDAMDVFNEETNCEKVMFVHPNQLTQLRHDENFISKDKYSGNVVMSGEVGMVSNCRIIPSRRVRTNSEDLYVVTKSAPSDWSTKYTSYYTAQTSGGKVTYTAVASATPAPAWEADKYYKKQTAGSMYMNPIVQLETAEDTEDITPALTIYVKRDTNVETERQTLKRVTDISADKFYAVALTNQSKTVLAGFAKNE